MKKFQVKTRDGRVLMELRPYAELRAWEVVVPLGSILEPAWESGTLNLKSAFLENFWKKFVLETFMPRDLEVVVDEP